MTFKEKIVRLRKQRGLTQDEFASAVGVSRQAVYKWESGQSYPEVAKLIEIKALFEISIDNLLDDSFEVEAPEKKKRKRAAAPAPEAAAPEATVDETEKTEAEAVAEEPAAEEETAPEAEAVEAETVEKEEKRGFFARLFSRK